MASKTRGEEMPRRRICFSTISARSTAKWSLPEGAPAALPEKKNRSRKLIGRLVRQCSKGGAAMRGEKRGRAQERAHRVRRAGDVFRRRAWRESPQFARARNQ